VADLVTILPRLPTATATTYVDLKDYYVPALSHIDMPGCFVVYVSAVTSRFCRFLTPVLFNFNSFIALYRNIFLAQTVR
jgi:hypothetical protein